MVIQNCKGAIQLFEHQDACHVMRECERRQGPLAIGAFPDRFCSASKASNDERQSTLFLIHVLAQKISKLARTPHRSTRIEQDDAIGAIERCENSGRFVLEATFAVSGLYIFQFRNLDGRECSMRAANLRKRGR